MISLMNSWEPGGNDTCGGLHREGIRNGLNFLWGWVTVVQALKLPEPDISWMTAPPKRRDFVSWLNEP
jgi:hypothetical protein